MKKLFALLLSLALFTLSACSSSPPPAGNDSTPAAEPSNTAAEPDPEPKLLEVFLNIETTGEDGQPVFTIRSNLPDETVLSLELSLDDLPAGGRDDYFEQRELTISGGTATTETFSNAGNPLAGDYSLSLMVLPSDQSAEVQKIIGEKGENLTGQLVNQAGDSQYIIASFPYHSPYTDTPAPAALSLEDVDLAIRTSLSAGFGENYTLTADGLTYTANVWGDGVAMNATLAALGNSENLEVWNNLVSSTISAAENVQSILDSSGHGDMVFIMQIANDMNESHDTVLLSVSLGTVFYDYVNGIDHIS